MHKYQYTSNFQSIQLFMKAVAGLNHTLTVTYKNIFSQVSLVSDKSTRIAYKIYLRDNKDIYFMLYRVPQGYQLVTIDRTSKEEINSIVFNHTNYTELDTVTIFINRIMPVITSMIKKPSSPNKTS